MIRILLVGCGGSAGINFIKALRLSRERLYIVGTDINKYYLEMSPVDKRYLLKKEKNKNGLYIKKLQQIIKQEKIDFIHAQPDPEVKILSDYRDLLKTNKMFPSKEAIDICQDKLKTYTCLKKKKIQVVSTIHVKNINTLKSIFKNNKKIIWIRARKGAGGKASLPIKKYEHAKAWIEYWIDRGLHWNDFVASEYLPGKEVSWLSIWKNGKLICSQQKERIEWVQAGISPSNVTGTTAIQKTVHYENFNKIATDTIIAVDKIPNGVYVVDLKENEMGIPCVMEINPGRFFTTSLFFATAGYNMPLLYVKLGLGMSVKKIAQYNLVPENIFWIRVTDGGPTMVLGENWTFKSI